MLFKRSKKAADGYVLDEQHPCRAEHELASKLLQHYSKTAAPRWDFKLKASPPGAAIAALDRDASHRYVLVMLERIPPLEPKGQFTSDALSGVLIESLKYILRRKLPLQAAELSSMARWIGRDPQNRRLWSHPFSGFTKAIENFAAKNDVSDELAADVQLVIDTLTHPRFGQDKDKFPLIDRMEQAIGRAPECMIHPGEAWSDAALSYLEALPDAKSAEWAALLNHCRTATMSKPTAKWSKAAAPLLQAVGHEEFVRFMKACIPLVDKPRTDVIESWGEYEIDPNVLICDPHADLLRGLTWLCTFEPHADLTRLLTGLAITAYKKVPGLGPRAVKIGNACVWALGGIPGLDAIGQLAILKIRVKFGTAQNGIEKALSAAAQRENLPREELEEMAVPAYGLETVGELRESFGDFTARLTVTSTSSTRLDWVKSDGKIQKSVPKRIKEDHPDELKELKRAAKDLQKMLPAQRDRLDGLFRQEKRWPFAVWRERYLDHPLVGTLARRLIWTFDDGTAARTGIWHKSNLVDLEGSQIDCATAHTEVRLWHPIESETDVVLAWRDWLLEHEVQQPFKQAHREIYLLTDAERTTGTYSNRYAAHVLKQHQFNALCATRAWSSSLRLMVDDEYEPPTLELSHLDLRAEYWVEGAGEEYGTDTTEAGSFLYLVTDQVRFYPRNAATNWAHACGGGYATHGQDEARNHPLPLTEIPPLAFSEVMRDIDLFVGVASVGNDPNWADGGAAGRYVDYWHNYSFGELAASAQTRRDVLKGLIPRLKIADRCEIQDRFLVVRGDLRTYKIHLGSGNILMEPDDQYLCIVPAQGKKSDGLFLPFEGDTRLSVILSKALLLAADKKITDSVIVQQIKK